MSKLEFLYFSLGDLDFKIDSFSESQFIYPTLISFNMDDYASFLDECLMSHPRYVGRYPVYINSYNGIKVDVNKSVKSYMQ